MTANARDLNALLPLALGRHGVTLDVLPDNRVVVRYGRLRAEALLPPSLDTGPAPRLVIQLRSILVGLAVRQMVRAPFVHVSGRLIVVELAEVPQLREFHPLWRHLVRATFATRRDQIDVGFELAI